MPTRGMKEDVIFKSPFSALSTALQAELVKLNVWSPNLSRDLPKRWEKHGSLVLLPADCFTSPQWRLLGKDLWRIVAACLRVERVAKKRRVENNDFRSPFIELLYGSDGWVEHVDNKIVYHYDVTKCMFSIGNITEKLRIAQFDCHSETVVDLFAGIGYFTLPYLLHAGASFVFACEWNPDAVEALRRNLDANKCASRCEVLEGDCRSVCPSQVADRVNLGLLPSCRQYLLTACKALKPTGGVLHVHENVTSGRFAMQPPVEQRLSPPPELTKVDAPDSAAPIDSTTVPLANDASSSDDEVQPDDDDSMPTDDNEGETKRPRLRKRSSLAAQIIAGCMPPPPSVTENESGATSGRAIDAAWKAFAQECAEKCVGFLNNLYDVEWTAVILRVGKIKSYAPHIDHVVADIELRPKGNCISANAENKRA